MPVQYTFFGRPIALRMPPRRFQLVFGILVLFTIGLLFGTSAPSRVPYIQDFQVFKPGSHKAPQQENSSNGDTAWYSHWGWRNPFSSSVTFDENRAVLPPLKTRPPIYTFYDPILKSSQQVRDAEQELLLIWRRAWWAQGFQPVVLGRAEAMNNPMYESLQHLDLEPTMEHELARWLAWEHMGTGICANWLALPMAPYDDSLMTFLRRGEFPLLTRIEGLGNGIFYGEKQSISVALKQAVNSGSLSTAKTMIDALGIKAFNVDPTGGKSVSFYSSDNISKLYSTISAELESEDPATGFVHLASLITSHLQQTWQSVHTQGIGILSPYIGQRTFPVLLAPAISLARNLSACPHTPLPASCPPNRQKCSPCSQSKTPKLFLPSSAPNKTDIFTIGTVPHPYTITSLVTRLSNFNARWIRRTGLKNRDLWIRSATNSLYDKSVGGAGRTVGFKDLVASDTGYAHSIWLTAERETHKDLDWIFGFEIMRNLTEADLPPPPEFEVAETHDALVEEDELLQKARKAIKSPVLPAKGVTNAVEAWNLADTEAWRFTRAWSARRRMERLKWEEEEKKYAGAESKARGGDRWFG
ncbi:hypothetical protein K402DRAFT_389093 [Aulographum hederae CBS 113979]|uniref:Uncharacterized protein n=1 Tax=Aulographum hederae CBS 113979 TaxID=1176131 RepID=A0A6G1HF67_9PEZI|nr:hypothetical protein K402DRAFT_389093 [Aulographum hederae CBS 113979]